MSWRLLAIVVRLGIGLVLFYVSLTVLVALLRTPQFQHFLVLVSLALGGLWWCYTKLPDWLQEMIRALWKWRSHEE